jgi:2'-5' RNA ligase
MKRIFIALKVEAGDTLLKMVSSYKSLLRSENIRWTNPENIHITLSFLGDTEEERINDINSMLQNKCDGSGSIELFIKGSGVFRNINDPRIIWIGIEPSEKLLSLNGNIIKGLTELDMKTEDRPFKPHLTIGRIKSLNDIVTLKALIDKYQNLEIQNTVINEVILYESILLQSGPVYKPLAKYALE